MDVGQLNLILNLINFGLISTILSSSLKNKKKKENLYKILGDFDYRSVKREILEFYGSTRIFGKEFPMVLYSLKEGFMDLDKVRFKIKMKYFKDELLLNFFQNVKFKYINLVESLKTFYNTLSLDKVERDFNYDLVFEFSIMDNVLKLFFNDLINKEIYKSNPIDFILAKPSKNLINLEYYKPLYLNFLIQTRDKYLLIFRRGKSYNYKDSLDFSITLPFKLHYTSFNIKDFILNELENRVKVRVEEVYLMGFGFDLYYFPSFILSFFVKIDNDYREIPYKIGREFRKSMYSFKSYKSLENIKEGEEFVDNITKKLEYIILNFKESLYFDISTALLLSIFKSKEVEGVREI